MNYHELRKNCFGLSLRIIVVLILSLNLFVANEAKGQCNITANHQTLNACYDSPVVLKATQSSGGTLFTEGFNTFTQLFNIGGTPFPVNSFVVTSSNDNSSSLVKVTDLKTEGTHGVEWNIYQFNAGDLDRLTSPVVDLSNNSAVQLKFDHIIFQNTNTPTPITQMLIEYSPDNGTTWQVFPASSYAGSSTSYTTTNNYFS